MKAHWQYLLYVIRHKWFVFQASLQFGYLGLTLWQAITHDLSKLSPVEWSPYVRSFYNSDGSKRETKTDSGTLDSSKLAAEFGQAWLHHQKTNLHHWQAWLLINDEDGLVALVMPLKYVAEMLADWDGAGRAINGKSDPGGWYTKNGKKMILHTATRAVVEMLLMRHYGWERQV